MATQAISSAAAPRIHLFRDDVNAELVRYLYRQAPGSMIAIVIVGLHSYLRPLEHRV